MIYRDRDGEPDLLGRLEGSSAQDARFSYDSDYLNRAFAKRELGISEQIPLDPDPYESDECSAFFQGLLPEGETLGNLSMLYQVPRNDYLRLLSRLGCESIGALTFLADGVDSSEYEPGLRAITPDEIEEFRVSPERAVTAESSSTRLSLAGAQSKVAWTLPTGKDASQAAAIDWLVPFGTAASTHIIKVSRHGEEDLAVNERACSLLATACGIEAARVCAVPDIPGAIAVERYDRKWEERPGGAKVIRLHQEDFCQALGFGGYLRYQPPGLDVNYLSIISRLIGETSSDPVDDKLECAKRIVFDFAIGNSDNHLKNYSLLYSSEWTSRRLAPLYDVTCIPLTSYATKMAFDIGGHREIAEIDARDIATVPKSMGVGEDAFARAVGEVVAGLSGVGLAESEDAHAGMAERILDNARPRVQVLESFLGM